MDPGENAEGDGRSPSLEILSEHVDVVHPMTIKPPETSLPCIDEEIDANPEGEETADLEVSVPSSSKGDRPLNLEICFCKNSSDVDDMYTPNSNDTYPAGVGLKNLGSTCYVNSVLQCLIHTVPLFTSIIASDKGDSWKCTYAGVANPKGFCLVCELREIFQSSTTGSGYLSPDKLVENLSFFSKSFRKNKQDDAHEYLTSIRTRLMEWHKEPSDSEENLIRKLFCVRTACRLTCKGCEHSTTRAEDLFDIGLPIDKADSLSMALQSYTGEVELDYTCETCGVTAGATQETKLNLIPLIVTFLLKRFNDKGKKVEKDVSFPLELDLSDYTATQSGQHKYVLYAIIVHGGNRAISGHYITFVRLSANEWSSFSDKLVSKVSEEVALSQEAYILFYVKKGTDWFSDAIVPYANNPITTNPKGCKFKETADLEVSVPSSSKGDGSLNEKSSKEKWIDSVFPKSFIYTPNSNDTNPAGVGLVNFGSTCYVNSVLQCLIHTVPLFRIIITSDKGDLWKCTCVENPGGFCLVCNLRRLFQMSTMGTGYVSAVKLVKNLSYFNERFREDREDDAHEFLTAIRSRLMEWHRKPEDSHLNFTRKLFCVRTLRWLTCKGCGRSTTREENLFEIGLSIDESDSLSMALKSYMLDELEYTCTSCRAATSATLIIRMKSFPLIVTFLLKRFDNKGNKIEKDVSFPLELDFVEYAAKRIGELKFVLYAIIVHKGETVMSGHYLTFVRLSPNKWSSFNDELVTEVSEEVALSQQAYILFYAKKGTDWFSDAIVPHEKRNHAMFLPF